MKKLSYKLTTTIATIAFSFSAHALVEAMIGPVPLDQNKNLIALAPKTNESEIIISRSQYVISYNKINRSPNWVAWKLDKDSLGPVKRTDNFQQDQDLQEYLTKHDSQYNAVLPTEYKGSCFDRGHQTPSADRTNSTEDNVATFTMSNMAPQTAYLNRVIWEHLESYTRNLIKQNNKTAFIITGPIYDQDFGKIGPNKDIKVPSKEFKIIYIVDADKTIESIDKSNPTISVIMPNTLKDGSKPIFTNGCAQSTSGATETEESLATNNDWQQFQTNLSTIESQANIKIQ